MTRARSLIVVCNLDCVKAKNLYQVEALPEYEFLFVSYTGSKGLPASSSIRSLTYPKPILVRALFVARLLLQVRRVIHHIELYTGQGAFLGFEFLVAKLLGIKVVVAERGPLLDYFGDRWTRRVALRFVYKLADQVWLRERYMPEALARITARDHFFNPNAVRLPSLDERSSFAARDIDFLWVNTFKAWRHPERFCAAVSEPPLDRMHAVMVGLMNIENQDLRAAEEAARRVAGANVRFEPFGDPTAFYRRAKYFVLPADIVYLNFSLLEAMAHGVVPIIADVDGAREIVDHEVDGVLFAHTPAGLREALLFAQSLSGSKWTMLSNNAVSKVTHKFSLGAWADRMRVLYKCLEKGPIRTTSEAADG